MSPITIIPITNPSNPTCLASGGWLHFGDRLTTATAAWWNALQPSLWEARRPATNLLRWLRLIGFSKNFGSHISTIIYTSNDLNLQSWTKERPWPSQIASWILQRHLHELKDMTNPSQLERYAKNGYMSVIVQGRAEKPFGTGPTKYLEALDWKGPTKPLRSKISSMFINHEVFQIHSVGKV